MDEPTVLRTTKIGGGFVKEDVLTYLDELNSKISGLEDELKAARESGPSDSQEITKFRNQIDNLQEKLNQSNNLLRSTKKENEELQKQHDADQKLIAQLKAGGAGQGAAPANAQSQAALEAAKKEIDKLRGELKAAAEKGGAPAQATPNA
jgi:chromosome segregation ATPase